MANKVLIIGLDGADWRILQPYLDDGLMPNLGRLLETGVSGPLRSTVPTNSSVAWCTFMTGRNPGKHGVYDFMQRAPGDPTRMVGVNSRSLRSELFFDVLGRHSRQVGAINVPITYPPFPVNGFMLGGMFVQEGKPYTFPEGLAAELDEQVGGFPVNCIRWRFMSGRMGELLDEAIVVTRQRARVLEYLIDRKDWDVLIQVFVSPDRLQHPLMHILDPEHPRYDRDLAQHFGPKMRTVFQTIDDMLGRSQEQIGKDGTLIIISDHGFRSVHKSIHPREILAREGLLKTSRNHTTVTQLGRNLVRSLLPQVLKQTLIKALPVSARPVGSSQEMANLIWSQSQAYVTTLSSQAVYVNLAGREPQGIVAGSAAYEHLLNDIQEVFLAERDPATGRHIIESVLRAKEFYNGPWADLAPDLLCIPAPGYTFAKGAQGHLRPFDYLTGDHDLDGMFVASGPGLRRGEKIHKAALMDIAPTVLYLAGVPIPRDMDGQVLDLFADRRLTTTPPIYEQGLTADKDSEYAFTAEEERCVEEHLRNLGYL
jgi:predicted AlkP superfamily phosphohydrolase/phosphomutase